jgi:hypothetical protein
MHKGLMLHMILVSGKRMIFQGTDGLSRGDTSIGVMSGISMLSCPIASGCSPKTRRFYQGLDF